MSNEAQDNMKTDGEQEQQIDNSAEAVMETNGESGMPVVSAEMNENGSGEKKEDEDERKLFVGGLAHGTGEDMLRQYFSTYGEVTKIDLKYDQETKKSRGFGFITFGSSQVLNDVLDVGAHTINGKVIDPKKAMAKPKPPPMKKVFVGGVSGDVSEETIREHFAVHGKIEKIELPIDKEANKRRAFCFVVYETESAAKSATQKNKQKIGNMSKECDVKLATPPASKEGAPGGGRFGFQSGGRFQAGAAGGTRGRGRGALQSQAGWGSQPYSQGGYQGGYGSNYDYSGYGSYGGGYGNGGGYESNYNWNYGPQGGYSQQNSGYGKVKRGAGSGSQGYHPYSQ